MKLFVALAVAAVSTAVGVPALAQNPSQIARAAHGASCPGCNLFQADLTYQEVRGLNFGGARLRQADLSFGVFSHVNFSRGDLRDLNGAGAVFTGSSFAGSNLANSSFVGSYLQGVNFAGANLEGVNFGGAEMNTASGLIQRQLDRACGDEATRLPRGLRIPRCR